MLALWMADMPLKLRLNAAFLVVAGVLVAFLFRAPVTGFWKLDYYYSLLALVVLAFFIMYRVRLLPAQRMKSLYASMLFLMLGLAAFLAGVEELMRLFLFLFLLDFLGFVRRRDSQIERGQ